MLDRLLDRCVQIRLFILKDTLTAVSESKDLFYITLTDPSENYLFPDATSTSRPTVIKTRKAQKSSISACVHLRVQSLGTHSSAAHGVTKSAAFSLNWKWTSDSSSRSQPIRATINSHLITSTFPTSTIACHSTWLNSSPSMETWQSKRSRRRHRQSRRKVDWLHRVHGAFMLKWNVLLCSQRNFHNFFYIKKFYIKS